MCNSVVGLAECCVQDRICPALCPQLALMPLADADTACCPNIAAYMSIEAHLQLSIRVKL